METESQEDVLKKDLGDVCSGGSFVARAENYPLRKTMVDHDQNRIIAMGKGQIRDEIHRDLLEGAGAFRGDRGKGGMGQVGVDLIGLASSAASNELADKGGHSWPPIILLEKGDGAEISTMSTHEGFMNIFYEEVSGRFGDVEAQFVIESALIKVPVLGVRMRKGYGVGVHCCKSINDKLVRRGGFRNLIGEGSIEHVNMQMGEEDLQGIVLGGIHRVFVREGIGGTHYGARGVVPFQVIVLEEHLPVGLSV